MNYNYVKPCVMHTLNTNKLQIFTERSLIVVAIDHDLLLSAFNSARHWITESGPRWQQVLYIYIYVCPSHFWNAIKLLCDVIAENL